LIDDAAPIAPHTCTSSPIAASIGRARSIAVGTPATIKPGRARPEEIEHGRQVYVAKGRQYREGLRRIG